MIGSLGVPELLFILVLALLIFGPRKLPEIGRTLGRALGEFRRATSDLKRTLDVELAAEDFRPSPSTGPSAAPPPARQAAPSALPAADDGAGDSPGAAPDSDPPAANSPEKA
jgi:TatA/E family protein of Tat protein translocase